MRIIHCADIHLDSAMVANLDRNKARERKGELLETFDRMIKYAADNAVDAVIIAGDLFDSHKISSTAANAVYKAVESNPLIDFYYLKGNHDADGFIEGFAAIPDNLKLFDGGWRYYHTGADGNICVCGIEPTLSGGVLRTDLSGLSLDGDKFNIAVLHGQDSAGGEGADAINLNALKDKGIDYLALGHIHGYKREKLDARGIYCYPGCLEGRGFDECGEHGFVLLYIDEDRHTYTDMFIPFAGRQLYELEVDVSNCMTTFDITAEIRSALGAAGYSHDSLLKIILTGEMSYDCEKNIDYLLKQFEHDFYFVKIYDRTKYRVDYGDFLLDQSLKGEFVRAVMNAADLSEEDKAKIIRFGIKALAGEVDEICGL